MGATYFLLIFSIIIGMVIFSALVVIVKHFPKIAVWIELIGYLILVISLVWLAFDFTAAKYNQDGQSLVINEKLDNLWRYLGDVKTYYSTKDLNELHKAYIDKTQYIKTVIEPINNEGWTKIHEYTSTVQMILLAVSGALIPAGRFSELIQKIGKKKQEK